MRRKIPSTQALLAFEASARHLSFTRAAYELSLTESAVSRQIATLEDFLGVPLFLRVKKRIYLTDAGRSYAGAVQQSLNKLEIDTQVTMAHDGSSLSLDLAVLPTFGLKWLMPRMGRFSARHPDILVNITAREEPFQFAEESFEAAIHYDHPVWANAFTTFLFSEELIPVCSPQVTAGAPCKHPRELADAVLLHKSGRPKSWWHWFEAVGVAHSDALKGPQYTMYAMLIEAARAGVGVALVPRTYVLEDLRAGRLLVPWELLVPGTKNYYFVVPERKQGSPVIQKFLDWLLDEAAQQAGQEETTDSVSSDSAHRLRPILRATPPERIDG